MKTYCIWAYRKQSPECWGIHGLSEASWSEPLDEEPK